MEEGIENAEASKPAHQIMYTNYICNHGGGEKLMYNVYIQ
jgi:hypothetical protein